MHPLFGSNDLDGRRKRQINLGGLSSNASQTALLEQAKTRREERDAQKRRAEAAVRVQAWWRGESEGKRVRNGLKQVLRDDTKGINGLRALVLIGRDEDALALWSSSMDQAGMLVLDK
jgi:ubiquitin-protein ligase E3 C